MPGSTARSRRVDGRIRRDERGRNAAWSSRRRRSDGRARARRGSDRRHQHRRSNRIVPACEAAGASVLMVVAPNDEPLILRGDAAAPDRRQRRRRCRSCCTTCPAQPASSWGSKRSVHLAREVDNIRWTSRTPVPTWPRPASGSTIMATSSRCSVGWGQPASGRPDRGRGRRDGRRGELAVGRQLRPDSPGVKCRVISTGTRLEWTAWTRSTTGRHHVRRP